MFCCHAVKISAKDTEKFSDFFLVYKDGDIFPAVAVVTLAGFWVCKIRVKTL